MLGTPNIKQGLGVDVAITPLMESSIQLWSAMYANEPYWKAGNIQTLNLPAAIAAEVARAATIEMEMQITGSARADFLNAQIRSVLADIRKNTEYACAKGGLVFKPYVSNGAISIDAVQADMFYPVAFDSNGNMTSCVFADQKTIGQLFYTRLELHVFSGGVYQIKNTAWCSSTRDTLGQQVALSEVPEWAQLVPEPIIRNVKKPLFAYFKMPFANNIEPSSPLGVSIYSRAVDLIKQADEQWTNFLWEFESGKRALYTSPDAFEKGKDGLPKIPDRRLFRLLDLSAVQIDKPGFFHDWTPTLREENLLNGLDAMLRRIEFNCGLSYGVLSNPEAVALTATEIKNSRQRYYSTVTDIQKQLEFTLDHLLYAMDVWATLYRLSPPGTYTVNYQFDDSVVSDHDTQFLQDIQAVSVGLPKYQFLMRNYGLDEATARKWVQESQSETPVPNFFAEEGA